MDGAQSACMDGARLVLWTLVHELLVIMHLWMPFDELWMILCVCACGFELCVTLDDIVGDMP